MRVVLVIITLLFALPSFASEIDGRFNDGPMGVKWGSSLETVKASFADGLLWPVIKNAEGVEFMYGVNGNGKLYWQNVPIELIQFGFTKEGKLLRAWLSFKKEEVETVYQACVDLQGRPGPAKFGEFSGETAYGWVLNSDVKVSLQINKREPYRWVVIGATTTASSLAKPSENKPSGA